MKCNKAILYILILLLAHPTEAKPLISIKGNDRKITDAYFKLHNKFFKKVCSHKIEHRYNKLFQEFNKAGYFVPVYNESELDIGSITKVLPLMDEKISWLSTLEKHLKTMKNFSSFEKHKTSLSKTLKELLDFKERYEKETRRERKELISISSKQSLNHLQSYFHRFIKEYSFLVSFNFPVDHLRLRADYDRFKDSEEAGAKRKANYVYLLRRIFEDGALNKKKSWSDRLLRTTLDSLYLRISKMDTFLTEDVRYDLDDMLNRLEKMLRIGRKEMLNRIKRWSGRVAEEKAFYKGLIREEQGRPVATKQTIKMIKQRGKTRYELKDFSLKKQVEVFGFWSKQTELMKALFSLETILFNEVGSYDGQGFSERRDVAQVVINRSQKDFYTKLEGDDFLLPYLLKTHSNEQIQKEKWLNILFKTGEFSFSYYFIHGSLRIYCPDMSRNGRRLRRQNIKIALKKIRNPNWNFFATRYFSRASMVARIDMSELWTGFKRMAEAPGPKVSKSLVLKKHYKKKKYEYLYSFDDLQSRRFDVMSIRNKIYSVLNKSKGPVFYRYRNPHFFSYFSSDPGSDY